MKRETYLSLMLKYLLSLYDTFINVPLCRMF